MDRFREVTGHAARAAPLRSRTDSEWATLVLRNPGLSHSRPEADEGKVEADLLAASSRGAGQLTESDIGNLRGLLDHEIARNTMRSYRSQWKRFLAWSMRRGVPALPADSGQVAAYLAERVELLGHKPATLRVAAAAIAFVHRAAGMENPCVRPEVKRTLRGATRKGEGAEAGEGADGRRACRDPGERLRPSTRARR